MRDKELSYWTCRGVQTSGFFVATIDDEVVGCCSYTKEVGDISRYLNLVLISILSRKITLRSTDYQWMLSTGEQE